MHASFSRELKGRTRTATLTLSAIDGRYCAQARSCPRGRAVARTRKLKGSLRSGFSASGGRRPILGFLEVPDPEIGFRPLSIHKSLVFGVVTLDKILKKKKGREGILEVSGDQQVLRSL